MNEEHSLGVLILALALTVGVILLLLLAFYYLGILLPIVLWKLGHPVLAVVQFLVATKALVYSGGKRK